jgi:uncharacterized phage-associated protein
MDRHGILKLLFFADIIHLNRHGRPIVGDQYRALPYGPVAQGTYDILKGDALAMEELDEDPMPLQDEGRYMVKGLRGHDPSVLSRSDVAALQEAYDRYGDLDFRARTDLSHDHVAYVRAVDADRRLMRYEDFFDPGRLDQEALEDLAAIAPLMRL